MKLSFTVATPDVKDPKILALKGDLEENLEGLAAYGYHGVEFMVRNVHTLNSEEIKKTCGNCNLEIAAISSGQLTFEDGLILSATEESLRKKSVQATKEVINFTSSVGSDLVNIGTLRGQLPHDPYQQTAANEAMVASMHEVLDYALTKNIRIAFEPQCRYVVNWHNSTFETYQWMNQFKQENFYLLFDVYHSMIEDISVSASLIKYRNNIGHVQVSDSNRKAPGWGQWNFKDLIRLLKSMDYHGFVSAEVVQKPSGLEAAKQAADFLLPLILETDFM